MSTEPTDFDTKTLLNEHSKDLSGLGEKMGKCYSSERYEEFQEAVKKVTLATLSSDEGTEKVKKHAGDYFQGKIIWGILVWLVTVIVAALLQKFFKIF